MYARPPARLAWYVYAGADDVDVNVDPRARAKTRSWMMVVSCSIEGVPCLAVRRARAKVNVNLGTPDDATGHAAERVLGRDILQHITY